MAHERSIIAIDVGNTRAKFGRFAISRSGVITPVEIVARMLNATDDLSQAFQQWWAGQHCPQPLAAMVAGSDPDVRDELIGRWPLKQCDPTVVNSYQQIPVTVDVDVPARVGIDRLLNVYAASKLLKLPQPVIAVDSGTATTVDLMTSDGMFRGGSILPGLRLSAHAMHDYTARLPLLNFDETLSTDLPEVPGRNTESAMRAGLFIGQLGAVKELASRLTDAAMGRFGEATEPHLFVTGGGGRQLVEYLPNATYVDSLALHGLAMLCFA